MQAVEKALFVIEKTREFGRMEGRILAKLPGWDRVSACRYLKTLSRLGWLDRVNDRGLPVYVLGRRVLGLFGPISDMRI
jgi:DNA-binding IclR family transcriptional regulator